MGQGAKEKIVGEVGSVHAAFIVDSLQQTADQVAKVAAQLDALNGKRVNVNVTMTQTGANGQPYQPSETELADFVQRQQDGVYRVLDAAQKRAQTLEQQGLRQRQQDEANAMRDEQEQTRLLAAEQEKRVQAFQQGANAFGSFLKAPMSALSGLSDAVNAVGESLNHAGQVLTSFGYRATLIAAPLIALGAAGAKAAIDTEQSVRMIATQTAGLDASNTEEFVARTTKAMRDLSTQVPQTAQDLAKAMYYLQTTMQISPDVANLMIEPVAKMATALNTTTEAYARTVSGILNTYEQYKSAEGLNKVNEMVFASITKARGVPAEVQSQIPDFLEVAKQAGASLPEALGVYTNISWKTASPSEAATQTTRLFQGLLDPKTWDQLKELKIPMFELVQGTGQWATQTEDLSKKAESAFGQIQTRLYGKEGVTGLYKQLADDQDRLNYATEEYGKKPTDARAHAVNMAQKELATVQAQIAVLEAQKGAVTATGTSQVWTGQIAQRDPIEVFKDLADRLAGMNKERQLEVLKGMFPNIREEKGYLALLDDISTLRQQIDGIADSTGKVENAFQTMNRSTQDQFEILQNSINKVFGNIFDDIIKPKLLPILELVEKLLTQFHDTAGGAQEFVVKFVLAAAAAGPLALVLGTLLTGLGALVSLIGTLISPIGLLGLIAGFTILKPLLEGIRSSIDDAGGGMQGFVVVLGELGVKLGIISQSDADKLFQNLGISVSQVQIDKVKDDVDKFISRLQALGKQIQDIIDQIGQWVNFISEHQDELAGGFVLLFAANILGSAIPAIAQLVIAITGIGAATQAMAPVAIGALAAIVASPAFVALMTFFGSMALLDQYRKSQPAGGSLPPGTSNEDLYSIYGPPGPDNNYWNGQWNPQTTNGAQAGVDLDVTSLAEKKRAAMDRNMWNVGPTTSENPFDWGGGAPDDGSSFDRAKRNFGVLPGMRAAPATGKTPGTPYYPPGTGKGAGGGGSLLGSGPLGPLGPVGRGSTPSGSDVLEQLGGAAWVGAFAQQHGGQDPFSYYAGQGYADPAAAALRDKAWGDQFFAKTGKAATKGDWETHWYETYNKQEVDEIDPTTGKPTGKKKKVIEGPVDAFTKAVEDAMKTLTDKTPDLKAAYTDPAQALIDKKAEITKAYTDPVQTFKDAVDALIAYIQAKLGGATGGGADDDMEDEVDDSGKPTGRRVKKGTNASRKKGSLGGKRAMDWGGAVVESGLHDLMKGEYILTNTQQHDLSAAIAALSQGGGQPGPITQHIYASPGMSVRELADEVIRRQQWQQSRRKGFRSR